jgi:hypothetical protein
MSGELAISTMPLQAAGSITLFGSAELSAGPVSLGISVEANVAAQAPKPLEVTAFLEVQLKTPLGKPKAKITMEWEKEGVPPYALPLSASLGIEHRKVTKNWTVEKGSSYIPDDDKLWSGIENPLVTVPSVPLVPPDVLLVLNFDKPVEDAGQVGDNPEQKPADELVGNYRFKYALKAVTLQYRDLWNEQVDDGLWEDYQTFANSQVDPGNAGYQLSGNWQVIPGSKTLQNTKLILNATTPFEISRLLDDNEYWLAFLNAQEPDYPCGPVEEEVQLCADFENRALGSEYPLFTENGYIFMSDFPMNVIAYQADWLSTEKALNAGGSFETIECLNIAAQASTGEIKLKVIDNVMLLAGISSASYLKFTDQFSGDVIELEVNNSGATIPASIHFPEVFFPGLPHKVWITCIIDDAPVAAFIAYDEDLNELDRVDQQSAEGAVTYILNSKTNPMRSIAILGNRVRIIEICYEQTRSTDISDILVVAPVEMAEIQVHLAKNSWGTIYLYDASDQQLEQIAFDFPWESADEDMQPVVIAAGDPFRSFLISGVYNLIRVCGVSVEARETFLNDSRLPTHLQTRLEENWGRHTAQILHPNKYYRLQVETSASRCKGEGAWTEETFTEYLFFKTGNPPGPPSELQEAVPDNERYDLSEPLKDLSAYIDHTIPSGATADEAQLPVYRSYDVGVVFNDSYLSQMYQMANLPLMLTFLDNNNQPVTGRDGQPLLLENLWEDNPDLVTTREETQYKNMLDENGCIQAVQVIPEQKQELQAASRELLFQPQTQYRARLLAGEEHTVYEFAFITSRYSNFAQHMHSFSNRIWHHFELQGDPAYVIDPVLLQQILDNPEDDNVKFEQLMQVLDLNPRTWPLRTEILALNDANATYGFLLESAEAMDWNRIEISADYSSESVPVSEVMDKVKLIGASFTPGNQWVELLVLETTDLEGYSLSTKSLTAAEEDAFVSFFTFGLLSDFNAGTILRIHNGTDPGHDPATTESTYLYADHTTDSFDPAGQQFQLMATDGELVQERIFLPESSFSEQSIEVVTAADGSRAFVFFRDLTQPIQTCLSGRYRFKFIYLRDAGNGLPALKRFGFDDPEEAVLEFSL